MELRSQLTKPNNNEENAKSEWIFKNIVTITIRNLDQTLTCMTVEI